MDIMDMLENFGLGLGIVICIIIILVIILFLGAIIPVLFFSLGRLLLYLIIIIAIIAVIYFIGKFVKDFIT